MYEHFGKVREIDGCTEVNEIYEQARAAVLPQVNWMIGPTSSGKTIIGQDLCDRTNMELVNYSQFLCENPNLSNKDEEFKTQAFINCLSYKTTPRVLLEDFP